MAYGKVLYKNKGATASYGPSSGTATSLNVSYPSNINAGDLIVICTSWKAATGTPSMSTPSGFNGPGAGYAQYNAGLGTQGSTNQGPVHCSIFYRIAVGTESGTLTINFSSGCRNIQSAMFLFSKPFDTEWGSIFGFGGYDTSAGLSWSTTNLNSNTIYAGETVITCINSNTSNAAYTYTSKAFTQAGLTFTNTVLTDENHAVALGQRFFVNQHYASAGTSSSSAWNYTMTCNYSTTASPTGPVIGLLIRIVPLKRLKRYTGSSWLRSPMKRWDGGAWRYCAANITGLKPMRRYSGFDWPQISTLYLYPDTPVFNITSAAQTVYTTMFNGHETDVSADAWITPSETKFHKNAFSLGLTVTQNTGAARTGYVYLSVEGVTYRNITINQDVGSDYISISPSPYSDWDYVQNLCSYSQFTVTSSGYWSAYWSSGYYFSSDISSGYDGYTINIWCNQVNYGSTINDTLILTCGTATAYIYATQGGYGAGCP